MGNECGSANSALEIATHLLGIKGIKCHTKKAISDGSRAI